MDVLVVRNEAQRILFEEELSGQISDGHWENSRPYDHWGPWTSAVVIVSPDGETVGRTFWAQKTAYNFTDRDLLDVVGDRMIEYVQEAGFVDYDEKALRKDLNDLKRIIKEFIDDDDFRAIAYEAAADQVQAYLDEELAKASDYTFENLVTDKQQEIAAVELQIAELNEVRLSLIEQLDLNIGRFDEEVEKAKAWRSEHYGKKVETLRRRAEEARRDAKAN